EDVWPAVKLSCLLRDSVVPWDGLDGRVEPSQRHRQRSAGKMALQDVLRSGTGVSPFANQHGQRLSGEIRSNLKKPVQPEQALFLVIVAVAHRLHQQHMVTHYRAKITAEAWKWAQSFESRFKVRAQQGLDDWPGCPFSIFRSQ